MVEDINGQKITEFVQKFGVVHTCTMLLALINGPIFVNSNNDTLNTPVPEKERTRAMNLFKDIGNYKILDTNVYSYRPEDPLMCLSEYKSLYLYVARVLRPV